MAIVGGACGASAIGLVRNAEWGRKLALVVLTINLIGDSLNALLRHDPKTLVGVPVAIAIIWYLFRSRGTAM